MAELLKASAVARMLGMSRPTFCRWLERNHDFPPAVDLGKTPRGRLVLRWDRAEVQAFLDRRGGKAFGKK